MVKRKLVRIYSVISWDFQRWTTFPFLTPFKTADISRRNHWIPCEWPLNDCRNFILMKNHYTDLSGGLWLVEANFAGGTTNQKHDPDLCRTRHQCGGISRRSSDFISWGNQWWMASKNFGCSQARNKHAFDKDKTSRIKPIKPIIVSI